MQNTIPKRIVFRFDERHELEWATIIEKYFASIGSDPAGDFYAHLVTPNMSSKMHIVLDLHSKTTSPFDLSVITYEVFKVKKTDELYVDSLSTRPRLTTVQSVSTTQ